MSAKIYKNQNKLRIILTASTDISGATVYIKYRKPDGTEGSWTGTIHDATTGQVRYDVVTTSEIDQSGPWTVWNYIVFSDTREAPGQPFNFTVYDPGY